MEEMMRIAVVGAGGVGGYFGGRLASAGLNVTFIARGATLEALRTKGLRVESINGDFTLENVQATDDCAAAGQFDAIVMAVKSWQIHDAAVRLVPMVGPDTVIVPLENGVEAPDVLATVLGPQHVLGGLCGIVSFVVEPGHIRHAASDPFVMFGELDNRRSQRVERLRDTFRSAGITADIPEDIHRSMWSKFLFIASLSGIGALTRVPIGEWRSMPEIRLIVDRSLREVVAVAHARGIDLGEDAVDRTWSRYDALAAASTSSLQRDMMEGKPSELDSQLGAVVRFGREAGVPTPVTEVLYHLLLPQERRARGL